MHLYYTNYFKQFGLEIKQKNHVKLQVCKKCNECGLSDRNSIICLFRQDFFKKFHPLSSINYFFWLRMTEDEMIMKNYGWNSDRKYRWLGLLCFFFSWKITSSVLGNHEIFSVRLPLCPLYQDLFHLLRIDFYVCHHI